MTSNEEKPAAPEENTTPDLHNLISAQFSANAGEEAIDALYQNIYQTFEGLIAGGFQIDSSDGTETIFTLYFSIGDNATLIQDIIRYAKAQGVDLTRI